MRLEFVKLKPVLRSRLFARFYYWYPLGLSGSGLLVVAVYLLGFAVSYYNLYALLISLLIFLLLAFLVVWGFVMRLRYFPAQNWHHPHQGQHLQRGQQQHQGQHLQHGQQQQDHSQRGDRAFLQPVDIHCYSRRRFRLLAVFEKKSLPSFFRFHVMAQLKQTVGRQTDIKMKREFSFAQSGSGSVSGAGDFGSYPAGGSNNHGDGSGNVSAEEPTLPYLLAFTLPLSGQVHGWFRGYFRDVLGLTRFAVCQQELSWLVLPAFSLAHQSLQLSLSKQEQSEKRRKESDHYEKLHLREYVPGDRAKDIQWKVSQRLDTLTTRVTVSAEKEIAKIQIFFDHVHSLNQQDSVRSLFHLEVLKSALLEYLKPGIAGIGGTGTGVGTGDIGAGARAADRDGIGVAGERDWAIHARVKFSDGQEVAVENEDDLQQLGKKLAQTQYIRPDQVKQALPMTSECRIFVTPYDTEIAAAEAAEQGQQIFMTGESSGHLANGLARERQPMLIDMVLVNVEEQIYWPGWWCLRNVQDMPTLLGLDWSLIGGHWRREQEPASDHVASASIQMIPIKPRYLK